MVYLELRADSTKSTDTDHSVIWVPGANRELAVHRMKFTTHGLSLVRMKNRFGIRVCAVHEEATHKELRPGDVHVKVDVNNICRLHPLRHGLQRQQVVQLLQSGSGRPNHLAASQNLKVDRGKWAPHVSHPTTSWPPSAEMSSSLWSDLSAESEQAPAGKDVE